MQFESEVRIRSTLLARRPRPLSGLIAVASVLAVLQVSVLGWRDPQTLDWLASTPGRVFEEGEYWRLLTAIGAHADIRHFASNAVFFTLFAYLLYGYFGFWIYPAAVVLLGSLTNALSLLTYPPGVHLVGASGVVYLMAGFWLTMYVLIERTRPLYKRLLQAVGITVIVFIPTNLAPEVSHRTHAIGGALGILAAAVYFIARKEKIRSLETAEVEHQFDDDDPDSG